MRAESEGQGTGSFVFCACPRLGVLPRLSPVGAGTRDLSDAVQDRRALGGGEVFGPPPLHAIAAGPDKAEVFLGLIVGVASRPAAFPVVPA